ncbi:GntR family transcriptional regulator, partial [Bacillus sp. RHFS18]|nr:GntR family transcriptional regulator [Bacillus sp. RHFS18]
RFIQEMAELGLSPEEMIDGIKQYAEEANDES